MSGNWVKKLASAVSGSQPAPSEEPEVSNRQKRLRLIHAIEERRQSRVVSYITADRQGAEGQIGRDAVRPMYNHIRVLGFEPVPRIDLFLYSQGGVVDVPWRLVTMLREYCQELSVLVPYKAHSAATLIVLGADEIVMGKKGELGPIDPILTRQHQGEQQSVVWEQMSVEDVMAYIAFLKERVGLDDEAAMGDNVKVLAERLPPWVIGSIYRTQSHIRLIARKLLASHHQPLADEKIDPIIDILAEKMYFHGHAIGRREAEELGLPVVRPDRELEDVMWQLFEAYEQLMQLDRPLQTIPPDKEELEMPITLACIESEARLDVYRGQFRLRNVRQMPPQLNLNLNLGLQLPPGLKPDQLPAEAHKVLQSMLQQMHAQIPAIIQAELKRQAPLVRTEWGLFNASWQEATNEEI